LVMFMKRIFDLFFSSVLLILLSPVMLITALAIAFTTGSPVIFKQQRPGLKCRLLCVYKFRTMNNEKSPDGNLLSDDRRLTLLGEFLRKYSLDELPQLINVLKGDMSFVGPRPLLMEYLPLYSGEQNRRHDVKPGITGWAQVNGRNTLTWEERFTMDVWYVDNYSFWLDLKILWLTVYKVAKSEGINQPGNATMDKFRGVGL
jgi:sugar transferase EpsL